LENYKKQQEEIAEMTKLIAKKDKYESLMLIVYRFRALAYKNLQKYEGAIADYTKLIEIFKTSPREEKTYKNRARIYKQFSQLDRENQINN